MRLHFTIGGYDRRETTRLRHGFQFSRIQFFFADHVRRRSGVYNKLILFPLVQGLMMQVDIDSPKVRRMLFMSPLIFGYFWRASTLLHGHIALAIASLLETDPQIFGHWGYADEVHLGKSFQAMDIGLECWRDVPRLW